MKANVLTANPIDLDLTSLVSPVLIMGPAYSGKSELAVNTLRTDFAARLLVTTDPEESEFKPRIAELQTKHAPNWRPEYLTATLVDTVVNLGADEPQIMIDSISQWIAARLVECSKKYSLEQTQDIVALEIKQIISALSETSKSRRLILVSTEVGGGPTPPGALARMFRLLCSKANVSLASTARSVIIMHAGIPLLIKSQFESPC